MKAPDRTETSIGTMVAQMSAGDTEMMVFDAPWQARVFALVVMMVEDGHMSWKDFQSHLVQETRQGESATDKGSLEPQESTYYQRWLNAAEHLLQELELLRPDELDGKIGSLKA
ncbi:MAG: nitrile hydratase accessory protein [Paracoccaceae bacterium]